jgi:S1-C subfamily serine protease
MGSGSGWVAADGVIVTNAHVVEAASAITVQLQGSGPSHVATAIWFDPRNDFALLRVAELAGVRPLPLVRRPRPGTVGAVIGFPRGRHAIRPARIGPTTSRLGGRIGNVRRGSPLRRTTRGYLTTPFFGRTEGGSSGGPVVDTSGRVLTTVWGGSSGSTSSGVPNRFVRSALRRMGPPVGVGRCTGPSSERLG